MSEPPHLLPPSASSAEVAQSQAQARLADLPPKCREMWSPDTCPASHLPWLAWAFSVDEWDTHWSDAQKRAVIRASFTVHKHKGTVAALRTALDALGYDIELLEWFQEAPPGPPYTFGLTADVTDRGIVPGLWAEIEAVALDAKNARSHLRYVRLRARVHGPFFVGGAVLSAERVEVQPYMLTELEARGPFFAGGAVIGYETITLYPRGQRVLALIDGAPLQLTDGALLRLMS